MKITNEEYGNQSINTFNYVEVRNLGGAYDKTHKKHPGMTLRQHYAGLAMQGYVVAPCTLSKEKVAQECVSFADALIAELNK